MPNLPISGLPAGTTVAGTEPFPSVQSPGGVATTVKLLASDIKTYTSNAPTFTGVAAFSAGAAALPSLIPTGDPNTGFWFPAADTIAASTGGSERLRINSSGNVGIGVTPNAWDTNLYGQLQLMNGYTAVYSDGAYAGAGGIAYNAYWSSTAGPVPTWKYTNSNRAGRYEFNGLVGGAGTHAWFTAPSGTAGADITFTQVMTISSAGNVGIGTTSPGAALDVFGNIYVSNTTTSGAAALVGRAAGSNTWIVGPDNSINGGTDQGLSLYSYGATNVRFYTNAFERMRITSAGDVGIGTTTTTTGKVSISTTTGGGNPALYVTGNDQGNVRVRLNNSGTGGTSFSLVGGNPGVSNAGFAIYDETNAATRMYITSAGNVGIGTTSPAKLLDVKTTAITSGTATNETIRITATFSGGLSAATTVGSLGFSDGTYQTALINALVETPASNAAGAMAFYTSTSGGVATECMRINSAGNVGIGTTSPGARLHSVVADGTSVLALSGTSKGIRVETNSTSLVIRGVDNTLSASYQPLGLGGTYLYFDTNGAVEAMRIDATGNVLVGTTSSPTTGTQCLTIETGTAPTATPADTVTFYSSDLSAGNTMPSFYTEGTIVGTGTPSANRTIAVRINGTVYYLLASTIP